MSQVIDGVLIASAVISLCVTLYLQSLTRVRLKRFSVQALSTTELSEPLEVQEDSKRPKVSLPWWYRVRRAMVTTGALVSRVAFAGLTVLAVVGIIGTVGLFVVYLASTIAQRVFLPHVSFDLILASGLVTLVVLGGALLRRVSTRERRIADLGDLGRFGLKEGTLRVPQFFLSNDLRSDAFNLGKDTAFRSRLFDILADRTRSAGLFRYRGSAVLPKQVYEGDSHGLTIDLKRDPTVEPSRGEYLSTSDEGTIEGAIRGEELEQTGIVVQLQADYLEAELRAAGIGSENIAGPTTQRQPVSAESLSFYWNCRFPHSGTHHFAIILSKVSSQHAAAADAENSTTSREVTESIGRIEHTTTVLRLDHMTKRQVKAIATVFGFVTALSGMTGVAKSALDVGHHFGWW